MAGYESWYLKASHPTEPLGVWIRYTTHQKPGEPETGSLWFTLFDPKPQAAKITPAPEELSRGDGAFIRIGDSSFADGRVSGAALDARWDLTFESPERELRHLPRDWMYRAPIPRTKLMSPFPAARFSGEVAFGDRTVTLDGWPGMVGHNWGAQHAERWIWLHGTNFEGRDPDTWLDVGIGRIKLGRWTTPWIANGVLSIAGDRHRLGGIERTRSTQINERPGGCTFTLPGRDLTVRGEVRAPRERFVGWVYADPDGSEHNTVNCSIAELRLTVTRSGAPAAPPLELSSPFGAAYELGMRETTHGVPIQPFPDG
jgi:hypothetical protein